MEIFEFPVTNSLIKLGTCLLAYLIRSIESSSWKFMFCLCLGLFFIHHEKNNSLCQPWKEIAEWNCFNLKLRLKLGCVSLQHWIHSGWFWIVMILVKIFYSSFINNLLNFFSLLHSLSQIPCHLHLLSFHILQWCGWRWKSSDLIQIFSKLLKFSYLLMQWNIIMHPWSSTWFQNLLIQFFSRCFLHHRNDYYYCFLTLKN